MIPRRIRLHNFLSYAECTVDFTGLHLAVLSGPNGHGKSALLDAMTWALWGEARGRLEDDRIRIGAEEMVVDFELESHGAVYRVVRKRTRKRGASLDFYQVLGDGTLVPLSGTTIAETEEEIVRRLHLDYDTFVNSAFIAQGRSNEFTAKSPKERKEVLRRILDLEQFELLAQRAYELRRERSEQCRAVEAECERLAQETEEVGAVEAALSQLASERRGVERELRAVEAEVQSLNEAAALREARQRVVDELREQEARYERQAAEVARRAAEATRRLQECETALARAVDVRARWLELQALRQEEAALADAAARFHELERLRATHERAIAVAREQLVVQLEERRRELAESRAYVEQADALAEELEALRRRRREREGQRAAAEGARAQAEARRREAVARRTEAENVRRLAQELKEQEEQLRSALGSPECPLCHQPLTPEHVERVLTESAERRRSLKGEYDALLAEAAEHDRAAADAERHVDELLRRLDAEEQEDRAREVALEATLRAAEEARERIPALEQAVRDLDETLRLERHAPEERIALRAIDAELARSPYDAARHDELRRRIAAIRSVEDELRLLERAEEQRDALRRELDLLARERDRLSEELAETLQRRTKAEAELAATADVQPLLAERSLALAALRDRLSDLDVSTGRLQERLRALEASAARLAELRDRAASLREEVGLYDELRKAFGRDGVQAMLIDEAVPRIREIANGLLDRMTGGRIHVDIQTQRSLSSREGVQETLDIVVGDELGPRPYEMYSGGEAFRVDFALRIALARLLAERAGAPLATLIVDEGFGTQDRDGIDRLVEVLNAVASEFELILVVTHLDELRERFERRIEVTKDPERGSVARVL